jgi:hypothetical protein
MQELHLDDTEDPAAEARQAEALREAALATLQNGGCGLAPWSWCRQMRLWQDNYRHHYSFPMEKWDDRLGLHVHDDGTIKPAGQVFRDLATLLATVPLRAFDAATGRVQTARGELLISIVAGPRQGASLYHVAAERCFAAMARTTLAWAGRPLVTGPQGVYVYAFALDGVDIPAAPVLYAKAEAPGTLIVHSAGSPRAVHLVERAHGEDRVLDTMAATSTPGGVTLEIAPTQQAYWVRITW